MEPKKLTELQVRLMIFLEASNKQHNRQDLMQALSTDRCSLSLAIVPLAGFFIKIEKERNNFVGKNPDLISLTEGGEIAIRGWRLANG